MDDAVQGYKALKSMSNSQPCLMRKTPLVAALQNRWTPQHLVRASCLICHSHLPRFAAPHSSIDWRCSLCAQVTSIPDNSAKCAVLCSTPGRSRFIECHDASNVFGSFYHVREPESQRLEMGWREFLQCTQKWRSRPLYLKVNAGDHITMLHVLWCFAAGFHATIDAAITAMTCRKPSWCTPTVERQPWARCQCERSWIGLSLWDKHTRQNLRVCGVRVEHSALSHNAVDRRCFCASVLHTYTCSDAFAGKIDWLWLHSLLHAQKHGPVLQVQLQIGPPNGLLPARYELLDRLLAQVNGRRRILLIPPSQVSHQSLCCAARSDAPPNS